MRWESLGEFYYVRWVGVDPQDGQQIWLDKDGNETKVYDENNAAYTGKQQYAPWSGGFSTRFDWKGFSVNADFSFMLGKYMIDNDRYFVENLQFRRAIEPNGRNGKHVDYSGTGNRYCGC